MSTQSIKEAVFNSITNTVFSDSRSQPNHTAEKIKSCFQCRRCGRQFPSDKNLRQHMWCLSDKHVNAAAEKANQQPGANQVTNQFHRFISQRPKPLISPPLYLGPFRDDLLRVIERFYPFKVPS